MTSSLTLDDDRLETFRVVHLRINLQSVRAAVLAQPHQRLFVFEQRDESVDRFPPVKLHARVSHEGADLITSLAVLDGVFQAAPARAHDGSAASECFHLRETE